MRNERNQGDPDAANLARARLCIGREGKRGRQLIETVYDATLGNRGVLTGPVCQLGCDYAVLERTCLIVLQSSGSKDLHD